MLNTLFLYTDIIHNPTVPPTTTFIIHSCQLVAVDILVLPQTAKVKFRSVARSCIFTVTNNYFMVLR